eukprot:CAMPEP_0175239116 /NCGR_PEP_ID=MMETSP0093-20121207/29380_1 /TAXON_ID=311494 /ORGANISM="Alexandrium monilatum, Strain CCMP3105" /LENGTH=217 /DNA_ID=CAMNT_0016533137 /DNA_START=73 /DNA_END=725 /DNA_ORIENTATION=-
MATVTRVPFPQGLQPCGASYLMQPDPVSEMCNSLDILKWRDAFDWFVLSPHDAPALPAAWRTPWAASALSLKVTASSASSKVSQPAPRTLFLSAGSFALFLTSSKIAARKQNEQLPRRPPKARAGSARAGPARDGSLRASAQARALAALRGREAQLGSPLPGGPPAGGPLGAAVRQGRDRHSRRALVPLGGQIPGDPRRRPLPLGPASGTSTLQLVV